MVSRSRKVFIDSSILVAFVDRGASNHSIASKAVEDLASMSCHLYTSSQVITDSYALLSRGISTTIALEFLLSMLQSGIEILFPQKTDLITAHRILRVNRSRQISIGEALNATLMQKKGITQILTFTRWNNLFGTSVSNLILV